MRPYALSLLGIKFQTVVLLFINQCILNNQNAASVMVLLVRMAYVL